MPVWRMLPPVRLAAAAVLVVTLAACGGGPASSGPGATSGSGATAAPPAGTAAAGTAAAIDFSQVDLCAIVPEGTIRALTGQVDFATTKSADRSSAKCFWGVTRPGVPQYVEVQAFRRNDLANYTISPNGAACPAAPVPGIGDEAVGGVCSGDQSKVWLAARAGSVVVQVIVNEPPGGLTPASLVDVVNGVIAGLG